ncbi:MAG: 4-hydroxy-tetrahydrodipicolinate synthase [Eubacteriales bacterium]|nr:4-hydroxy-tetrahydrodipicolinate synthase [Eubacteriales bacterium]
MPSLFQGSAVALVTPFLNGKVDVAAIERLVERQIEGGSKALIVCGTTGEPCTMEADECELVVRTVVKAAHGRVPIVAGTGSNSTQHVIQTAKRYEDLGCDAQLVVTPYYNKTTQEGLYRHYMTVAEQTKLPIVIYNVPSRTALDISPEVLDRLADCEQIIALKESSYNLPYVMEKVRRVGDRLALYSGNDDMVTPIMGIGGKGVISVVANVLPATVAEMTNSYLRGDCDTALSLQLTLLPLIRALFAEVNPIPCKAAMEMLGLCSGEVRLPLIPIGDENRQKLRAALVAVGMEL